MTKAMKGIRIIKRLSNILPRHSSLTMQKSFVQPHFDYGDMLYDQPNNKRLSEKLKLFNTTLLWPLSAASKVYIKLKFTLN